MGKRYIKKRKKKKETNLIFYSQEKCCNLCEVVLDGMLSGLFWSVPNSETRTRQSEVMLIYCKLYIITLQVFQLKFVSLKHNRFASFQTN